MLLKNRVAVITGAATGIGRAGAKLFAKEGAKVVIADINDKDGQETVSSIKTDGYEATFVHADMTSVEDIENMIRSAVSTYGKLNIFWHNAAQSGQGGIDQLTEESYDKEMAVDLKAAVFGSKFAVPEIRKARGGSILFTNSIDGLRPNPIMLTYTVAKAGLRMLTRHLAVYLAQENIRVNSLCPGGVREDGQRTAFTLKTWDTLCKGSYMTDEELARLMMSRVPSRNSVRVEEVAHVALFLSSDMAKSITGVAFPIDGGATAA